MPESKKKTAKKTAKKAAPRRRGPTVGETLAQIGPDFIHRGARMMTPADAYNALANRRQLTRLFATSTPLKRYQKDAAVAFSLLRDFVDGRYRHLPYHVISVKVFAFHYLLTDTDLIADDLPMVGRMDDASVFRTCRDFASYETRRYKKWAKERGKEF